MPTPKQLIRVGHSPDPDDAFMFYALANGRIDTGDYCFEHELVDIETLNRRALTADLELTAISTHAYAYVHDHYGLCSCGTSMGDGYGPMVVMPHACTIRDLRDKTIAIPGQWTSAYLALRLLLGNDFAFVVVPFDRIIQTVQDGEYQGQNVDAGLIIHEGQLTFGDYQLQLVVDLGVWWKAETGLPLPLGGNAVRKNLGRKTMQDIQQLLKESILYALNHRGEALEYAGQFGRDLDVARSDAFVGMYVNDWTLDLGLRGRQAVQELLHRGHAAGILPQRITPEFVN